jgi:hypothetical protein
MSIRQGTSAAYLVAKLKRDREAAHGVVKRLAETVRGFLAPIGLFEAWLALDELKAMVEREKRREDERLRKFGSEAVLDQPDDRFAAGLDAECSAKGVERLERLLRQQEGDAP